MEHTDGGVPKKSNGPMIIGGTVIVLALVALGAYASMKQGSSVSDMNYSTASLPSGTTGQVPATPTPRAIPDPATTTATKETSGGAATSGYKDGTYTADGHYSIPGGSEIIGISLTIKDGVIVDAVGTVKGLRPNSQKFQGIFVANFRDQVVGKKLADVSLSNVSGSSLSPLGFNDAVVQIRTQAQV